MCDAFLEITECVCKKINGGTHLSYEEQCFYRGYGTALKEKELISEREYIVLEKLIDLSGSQ